MRSPKNIRVLIACEESQTVCAAFLERGFDAWSCDIQPASGPRPDRHYQCDLSDMLPRIAHNFDLMIAHPPCTYLSRVQAHCMYNKSGNINNERLMKMQDARDFFMMCLTSNIKYIAVENPVPMKIAGLPRASQIIQPYQFGHPYSKKTCLWLKNLPVLLPTLYSPTWQSYTDKYRDAKTRSVTFKGIADAMADQWGSFIVKDLNKQ